MLSDLGYILWVEGEIPMPEIKFEVRGMTCNMCVKHVREALEDLSGVDRVKVDLKNKEAVIDYDDTLVNPEQFRSAVKEAGYELL